MPPSAPRPLEAADARRRRLLGVALATPLVALALTVAPGAAGASTAATQHVFSWGTFGEHGSVDAPVLSPTLISGIPGTITQLVATNAATYALTSAGTVWAFGANDFGELGNGTTTNSFTTAVQVKFPAGTVITSLPSPMPYATALAIDKSGNIWGWGTDRGGELCLGNTHDQLLPVKLPLTNVTAATGAGLHASYESGGKLYSCGVNNVGQLGTGNNTTSLVPVLVGGGSSGPAAPGAVTQLYSSFDNTGALLTDGSFWEWGHNQNGQLGDNNLNNENLPVKVPLPAPVTEGFIGGNDAADGQTLVVLGGSMAGTIMGWGSDGDGELCDDVVATGVDTPVTITPPHGVTWNFVTSGGSTSYALDTQHALWSCGFNKTGEIGNGKKSAPVLQPVSVLANVTQVSATSRNVAAITG